MPASLVVAQWIAVAIFATQVKHNGWFYFQGGDQLWHYTSSWQLASWSLPPAVVGYVWPFVLAPIAVFAGANLIAALPAIVLFQVAVLLPLAVLCVWWIARRLGGPAFGLLAGVSWIVLPYAVIPLFEPRYHERYVDQFLPQAFGLTAMSDFPSMVALLVAAVFALRVFDSASPRLVDALAAGAAAGVAVGLKPANLMFVPGLLAAIAVARRWRHLGVAVLALLPAIGVLYAWKKLGLGEAPAFVETDLAVTPRGPIPVLDRYLDLDFAQLVLNEDYLREYFWSVRLLEWAPLAGIVAVFRRSPPAAVLLAFWFGVFLLAKGTSHLVSVELGSFFRMLMPAFPAYFLLATSVMLLVPRVGARLLEDARALPYAWNRRLALILAVALLGIAAAPLPVILAAPPDQSRQVVSDTRLNLRWIVSDALDLRAEARAGGVRLTWQRPSGLTNAETFFRVLRGRAGSYLECSEASDVPVFCNLSMEARANLGGTSYFAADPPEEDWVYRVGLVVKSPAGGTEGDIVLVSPEVDPRS